MKKFLILVAGSLAINSYGQCTIAGNNTIKVNEIASFSVNAKAQCEECYLWKSSIDQNLKIDGNSKVNQINVKSTSPGRNTISVSMLTDNGLLQCEKIVDVVDPQQNLQENNCGITINDFKDVKVSESVISFFPNENSNDYVYKWTVTYANGEVQESKEKIPQFFFSEINYITSVKFRITNKSPICYYTISKKFEQNYWKPTTSKIGKIEQKVYSPGNYSEYVKTEDKTNSSSQNN